MLNLSRYGMVALGISLGGCTTATADSPAAADSAEQASTVAAVYSVPVAAELVVAARMPVSNVRWKADARSAVLDYDLPQELTGLRQRVKLEGVFDATRNAYVLAGPIGTGECTVVGAALRCTEQLTNVTVDAAAAARLTPPSVDLLKRQSVIEQFAVDPVGILDATLRVRGGGRDD